MSNSPKAPRNVWKYSWEPPFAPTVEQDAALLHSGDLTYLHCGIANSVG